MDYVIQQAKHENIIQITPLIYEAIGDIAYNLTGETNEKTM